MDLHQHIAGLNQPLRPAVVCYLLREDKVLLGLRKRVSWGLGENLISGIGGKVELEEEAFTQGALIRHETDDETLVREVQEEIAVTPVGFEQMGRVRFIFPAKPKWNQDVAVYICRTWEGDPMESEEIAPEWYEIARLAEIEHRMWEDNRLWVPQVLAGEPVQGVFLYADDNATVLDYQL